jgi:hypothetical protein
MKAHLASAAYDIPYYGFYPTVSVFGGLPIARALYRVTAFSSYLPLMSWRYAEVTESHYVSYRTFHCEVSEGSQS